MGGESLRAAQVTDLGIAGDRGWGIYDTKTATVLTARRTPELLFASARLAGDELVVRLPDGAELDEAGADDPLSTWLGREVELRRAGADGGVFENPLDAEWETDWVRWKGPPRAWHDSTRTRVSVASTATFAGRDPRRFRINVIVDGDAEDELVGRSILIGDVRLEVSKRIDRCVMVTRPQPGIERDLDVLRTINAERDGCLGIGCLVTASGELAIGDELR
jgi:uncharacterized protein YcbX